MKLKRTLLFHPPAEASRNAFVDEYGENARKCLDWLEQETRISPESGRRIEGPSQRFVLAIEVGVGSGTYRCQAVYIFNCTAVKWLLFSYKSTPSGNSAPSP